MIVCHCRAVSDREIRSAVDRGAGDVVAVGEGCGAGTGCAGCHQRIEEMLAALRSAGRALQLS